MLADSPRSDASRSVTTPAVAGVTIPIRAFGRGNARLASAVDQRERAILAQRWAERVVQAAAPLLIVVVSSDPDVRRWADQLELAALDDPGTLDDAAAAGRDHLRALGCARVIIAHADLPRARTLAPLARDASRAIVALVPCHRDDGTPVMSVPTAFNFTFTYGADSYRRHAAEARRLGLGVRVIRDADLAFDVDVPEDLVALAADLQGLATP